MVVGDSAGGNLAAAVTARAIIENVRVPDGCVLAYPALHIDVKYTPSYLNVIENRILPQGILLLCLNAYAPVGLVDRKDVLLSPLLLPDEVVAKFPPTRIMVGDSDPLLDDSIRFADRLFHLTAHQDVVLRVYEGVDHGFLSLDLKYYGVSVFKEAVLRAAEFLATLLKSPLKVDVTDRLFENAEEMDSSSNDFDGL